MKMTRVFILIMLALTLVFSGCKKKSTTAVGAAPAAAPAPAPASEPKGEPAPPHAPNEPPDEKKGDDDDEPPPKPDPDDDSPDPKEPWHLPGPDPKDKAGWVITPAEVIKSYKLGMPEAKLREKVLHALEDGHIKQPMKATEAQQKAMIAAGVTKNMVHFLLNLPVD